MAITVGELEKIHRKDDKKLEGNIYKVTSIMNGTYNTGTVVIKEGSLLKILPKVLSSAFIKFGIVTHDNIGGYTLPNTTKLELVSNNIQTVGEMELLSVVEQENLVGNIYKVIVEGVEEYKGLVQHDEVVKIDKTSGGILYFNYLGSNAKNRSFFIFNEVKLKLINSESKSDTKKAVICLKGHNKEEGYISLNDKGYLPVKHINDAVEFLGTKTIDIAIKEINKLFTKLENPPTVTIKFV